MSASGGLIPGPGPDRSRPVLVRPPVLYIEPGAILDTGLWCVGCALPAAVKVEVLAVTDDGFTPVGSGVIWCDDCRHLCQSRHGCDPR